jgi:mannose-6-phosphate isomerase-like protein (cupin superfamily)
MKGQYFVADARDAIAVKQISRAITAWEPLLSLKFTRGESLYGGILVSYGLSVGEPTMLTFRDRHQEMNSGDAIVLVPSVRVAAQPTADVLWICHEGLAPEHLRGPEGLALGFEHFSFAGGAADHSICGKRRQVLPTTDVRYRVQYHFVEIENAEPHAHDDMVELYYVMSGEGELCVGPSLDQLAGVPIRAGQLLVVGPGLYHVPSNGLGMCIWFLYNEMAHRRRVRETSP